MGLEDLADVHAAGHAERVEDDVDGRAVGQEGHVLLGQDLGDHALVAVATGHLVAFGDLALGATLTRTRRFTPGGSSSPLSRLNSRMSTTLPRSPCGRRRLESFTSRAFSPKMARSRRSSGGQLGLALGRDLADQDVARLHLGADVDDAVLVEVLERVLADVGDVAGDLLGAELGVARLQLVLLDVDAGEEVLAHQPLADDDGVLVVAALPAHEGDQHVVAQGQLAVVGRGGVGEDRVLGHAHAHLHDRVGG